MVSNAQSWQYDGHSLIINNLNLDTMMPGAPGQERFPGKISRQKKGRSPIENPGTSGKVRDFGSGGGGRRGFGGCFFIIFKKRVARKVRRSILFHFGLVVFRFHFGKPEK